MQLSNYIIDLGRAVAYYPGLRQLTGSTTSTIFLCQLLYWHGKSRDGWIWKTGEEIEEETGLTQNEQSTAKKNLKDLNIIDFEYKRLDHMTRYKVDIDQLNIMWEEWSGKKAEVNQKEQPELVKVKKEKANSEESSKARQKSMHKGVIKSKIENTLHVIATGYQWKDFIEFAYLREVKHNEKIEVFLEWALKNNYDPIYWTPIKMKSLFPQAFINRAKPEKKKEETIPIPIFEEEDVAPMPKSLGRKQELF